MLRDPTCDDTDVSYDMTPCVEEPADPCAGLEGKELKKCKQLEKCIRKRTDDSCDGQKLKKCEKKQKNKCKRKQKNKEKKGGKGGAEEGEIEGLFLNSLSGSWQEPRSSFSSKHHPTTVPNTSTITRIYGMLRYPIFPSLSPSRSRSRVR